MVRNYIYETIISKKKGPLVFIIRLVLYLFSLFYCFSVEVIKFLYRYRLLKVRRLNCKVISIGNITWGGTGKTPLVEFVAAKLKEKGRRIAILSRGYKSGDEPSLLARKLPDIPVLVGGKRIKNGQEAIRKFAVDTLILDDGFQHWRLFRDLDIVAINATNPFGNKNIIPAGILREPLRALSRADIFVLTKTGLNPDIEELESLLKRINPKAKLIHSVYEAEGIFDLSKNKVNLLDLKARPCAALSAIGDPDSFERILMNMGINITLRLRFPDHHNYSKEDINRIERKCLKNNIYKIITTEKDAVKLGKDIDYLVLKIRIKITEDEEFFKRIFSIF